MTRYYITIDQSTTSTKIFLIDEIACILDHMEKKHQQIYPQDGWVEHDPMEIYHNVLELMEHLLHKHEEVKTEIMAVTITNQRETALIWDHHSGEALHHAIVWQCRRTTTLCDSYKDVEQIVIAKTGLRINPYFSATKWVWLLNHCDLKDRDVRLGTMDSWLIYQLSNHQAHVCDHTNASRTLLYNLEIQAWDDELLNIFQIDKGMLPEIKMSDEIFAYTTFEGLLEQPIPIIGVIGDSQAALYAQDCTHPGDVKVTLGTGSSVLMNQGEHRIGATDGLVNTLAWKLYHTTNFASEAIINSCTDTLNWLKNELGLFDNDAELDNLTLQELRSEQVIIVPAFHGLALPYWNMNCKASILHISRSTTKRNFMCAGLCSIAYQIHDAIHAMQTSSGIQLYRIMADGGASKNKSLMQFLSDVCDCEIHVKKVSDLSAMGSFKIALYKLQKIALKQEEDVDIYVPMLDKEVRKRLLDIWHQAIHKTL